MWFRYCLNDFEFVPVAPIITGIAFVFKLHIHCISTVIISYFKLFSDSLSLLLCFGFTYALWCCSFIILRRQFMAFLLLAT